jgi:soluble lytic murein transglycosylase-like protein
LKKLIIPILFLYTMTAMATEFNNQTQATIEITEYLEDRYKGLKPKFKRRALKLVPLVVEYSEKYNLDPLLVSILISSESNWNVDSIGSIGERGLMQVHGIAARGHDLTKPEGQLAAGTAHFRRALDQCQGDLKKAFTAYATGSCDKNFLKAQRRMRLYKNAIKKFRR